MKLYWLKILAVCATVCLLVAFSGCASETPGSDQTSEGQSNLTSNSKVDIIDESDLNHSYYITDCGDCALSSHNDEWDGMDAAIVKWGEKTDRVYADSCPVILENGQYTGEMYTVNYVGVEIEFLNIFTETFTESFGTEIEDILSQTTFIFIPESHASEIKPGDCTLVFLDRVYHENFQNPQKAPYVWCEFAAGVKLGERLTESTFVDAPIFRIENNRIAVPEAFYAIEESTGNYQMQVMNDLCAANKLLTEQQNTADLFADGMSLESLARFFQLICS